MTANLAKAIKRIRKDPNKLSPESLQQLALDLLLDAPDDENGSAARLKVKLDCIRLLHDMMQDNKEPQDAAGTDDAADWKP